MPSVQGTRVHFEDACLLRRFSIVLFDKVAQLGYVFEQCLQVCVADLVREAGNQGFCFFRGLAAQTSWKEVSVG